MWKKNRNKGTCASEGFGVDPNRNFPFKWGQCITTSDNRCSSSDDCSSVVYRGPSPSSERETKAILAYAASIFPFRQRKGNVQVSEEKLNTPFAPDSEGVFIDVHSHGSLVGWPWGFANQRTPNDAGLGALGRKFASFSGYSLWAPKMPNRKCESEHSFAMCVPTSSLYILHSIPRKTCLAFIRWIRRRHNRYHVRLARCGFVLLRDRDEFLPALRNLVDCDK